MTNMKNITKILTVLAVSAFALTSCIKEVVPVTDYATSPVFLDLMEGRLRTLLEEIVDPSRPIHRKYDSNTCDYCSFKSICGV